MLKQNFLKRTMSAALALALLCGGMLAAQAEGTVSDDAANTSAEAVAVEQDASAAKLASADSVDELEQSMSTKDRAAVVKYVKTTVDWLCVRTGPGTKYSVIGSLEKGSPAAVVSTSGKWYRIWHGSGYGYISSKYTADLTSETPSAAEETAVSKTVTTTTSLNVRKGPGTSYAKLGALKKGAKAEVVAQSGKWYKIKYKDGYGYISSKYTKDVTSSGTETTETAISKTVTTTTSLNVRKGPGTGYAKLGALKKGAKAEVVAQSGKWYKIKYKDGYGYISSKYTKDTESAAVIKQVYTTCRLNVRKGAGTKYAVIGNLDENVAVSVVGQSGKWYKIQYNDGYGYISSKYTRANAA